MNLKVLEDSKNYTAMVCKLPHKQEVKGLDRLVKVNVQGNDCLVAKDEPEDCLYLFFCSETQLSAAFLKANNLYRHVELNSNPTAKPGFFEDNGRVKAMKFKGVISSGFLIPVLSLHSLADFTNLKVGSEFNVIDGVEICKKYVRPFQRSDGAKNKTKNSRVLDNIVDSKQAPEHFSTSHLMRNIHRLNLDDIVLLSVKQHGTSTRCGNVLVHRKLSWLERIAKYFGCKIQDQRYDYVVGSRHVIKSVGFNKKHFFKNDQTGEQFDLWTRVCKEEINGKLNHGEMVFGEIIGRDFNGKEIQPGYSYGFSKPEIFIYRISNINSQGIEIDLTYPQMKERAGQLGLKVCPEIYYGKLKDFLQDKINEHTNIFPAQFVLDNRNMAEVLEKVIYDTMLEKPDVLDNSVVSEGICVRLDKLHKPEIYKAKSKLFLAHETKINDSNEELEEIES